MSLIAKIRKSRQSRANVGGHEFIITRPTDIQASEMRYESNREAIHGVSAFVTGWDLTEHDILGVESDEPAPFSPDLFREWIDDQPDLWADLIQAVRGAYDDYCKRREARGEQSKSG